MNDSNGPAAPAGRPPEDGTQGDGEGRPTLAELRERQQELSQEIDAHLANLGRGQR